MKLNYYLLALGIAATTTFASCSDDDEPGGGNQQFPPFSNYATLISATPSVYNFEITPINSTDKVPVSVADQRFAPVAEVGKRYVLYYSNSTAESAKPNGLQPGPITLSMCSPMITQSVKVGLANDFNNWSLDMYDGVMIKEINGSGEWINMNVATIYSGSGPSFELVADRTSFLSGSAQLYLRNTANHAAATELKSAYASFNASEIWANENVKEAVVHFRHNSRDYSLTVQRSTGQQTIQPVDPTPAN